MVNRRFIADTMRQLFGYETVAADIVDFNPNMPPPKSDRRKREWKLQQL